MNILFLHSTSSFGGASKSLSELSAVLSNDIDIHVVAPNGNVVEFFNKAGMKVHISDVSQFNHTEYGYYKGLRWLVLIRELIYFPSSYHKIKRIIQTNSFDVIHLNEVTLLPWAWILKKFDIPVVVHVRSVYKPYHKTLRDKLFLNIFKENVSKVISIDQTVANSLPLGVDTQVIHNGLSFKHGMPVARVFNVDNANVLNVCIVGSLLRLKGLYEFIEAAKLLLSKGLNIKFHIVGTNPRNNNWLSRLYKAFRMFDDVESDLKLFVNENSLENNVIFHGLVKDISSFYSEMDVVCFPSYYNAPGRPVFEAAYYGIPSIVAVDRPTADTIVHNETGLVIEKPSSELLAEQLERLYYDRDFLAKLGAGARKLAEDNYSLEKNASAVKKIYEQVMTNKVA